MAAVFYKEGFKAKSTKRYKKQNEAEIYCIYFIHYPQLQAVKSQGGILREGLKESFPKLSWKKIGQAWAWCQEVVNLSPL